MESCSIYRTKYWIQFQNTYQKLFIGGKGRKREKANKKSLEIEMEGKVLNLLKTHRKTHMPAHKKKGREKWMKRLEYAVVVYSPRLFHSQAHNFFSSPSHRYLTSYYIHLFWHTCTICIHSYFRIYDLVLNFTVAPILIFRFGFYRLLPYSFFFLLDAFFLCSDFTLYRERERKELLER